MLTIPFYHYKVSNWKEKKEQLLDFVSNLSFKYFNKPADLYTTYGDQTSSIPLKILEDDILKFTTEVKYSGEINAEIWFQKYYENQFHSPHNHGAIGYSSVLYINFDKRMHDGTRFLAPFNDPDGNHVEFAPDVDEGSLIFFPSYLYHFTVPNKSDSIRIIMSMNIRKK
tara:strand:+ start:163 stop:669 length:507 start_codon:yes stop_codon:yes gene_type:complete